MSNVEDLVGKTLGNYRLERVLGHGRMGVVYLARDMALLRPTAVKILSWSDENSHSQEQIKWFLAEARSVARINHSGVVQIYHVAKHGNYRYIALEYIDGRSIEAIVSQDGPFPYDKATDILSQVASALHAAHVCGIIHRDVKPANLLCSTNGQVKLGDFGMALSYSSVTASSASLRIGTPYFMAPELWEGKPASPASDIYSLGATYYYLLTGQQAFNAKNLDELRLMHLNTPAPDPRAVVASIPVRCSEIVQRCMAKKQIDRFESAQQLSLVARNILRGPEVTGVREPDSQNSPTSQTLRNKIQSMAPRPAKGILSDVLGFAYEPFTDVEPHHCPYTGEPFLSIGKRLSQIFGQPGSIVILKGLPGSGRTVLCCQEAAKLDPSQLVVYLDMYADTARSLHDRLHGAIDDLSGVQPARGTDLDSLIQRLRKIGKNRSLPIVVFLDGFDIAGDPSNTSLKASLQALQSSRSIVLILVGAPGLDRDLQKQGYLAERGQIYPMTMPALDSLQTMAYINSWINYARDPTSSVLLVTPDASLQVAHWSAGNLALINRISNNMLYLAAFKKRRVVSSWDAWVASAKREKQIFVADDVGPEYIAQPEIWPAESALKIIDECRRKAQLPARREMELERVLGEIGKAGF